MRKGAWGLDMGQTRLIVCALVRSGALSACDARGQVLAPREIGLPLSRSIHRVRIGQLLDEETWNRLQRIVGLFADDDLQNVSFEEQERARQIVEAWREETLAATELTQARLHQLAKRLDAHGAKWDDQFAILQRVGASLQSLPRDGATTDFLQNIANWPHDDWRALWAQHRVLDSQLEAQHADLLQLHAFLTHAELAPPPEMQESRSRIMARFDQFLDDEKLLDDARHWRDEYSKNYAQWHAAQNAPERWLGWRRLEQSEVWRAVERLSQIATRRFGGDEIATQMRAERDKMCRFDGALRGEAVCSCRLKLGERVLVRDPNQTVALIDAVLTSFRHALREENVRDFLARHQNGAALLSWSESGDSDNGGALFSLLDGDSLQILEDAFRPRRRVERSWTELQSSTRTCRTRAQWQQAFLSWLDDEDNLNDDDEIVCDFSDL